MDAEQVNQPPPPAFPTPPPGKELKIPDHFVDASCPQNWTIAFLGRGRGALMLETGNKTHFTVAFCVQLENGKEGLEEVREKVVRKVREKGEERILDVWAGIRGMWGKHSALVGEESGLGLLQKEVVDWLIGEGYTMENRAPHIEVMKGGNGGGRGRGRGRGRQ